VLVDGWGWDVGMGASRAALQSISVARGSFGRGCPEKGG